MKKFLSLVLILRLACALPTGSATPSTTVWVTSNNPRIVDVYLGFEIGKTISIGSYP